MSSASWQNNMMAPVSPEAPWSSSSSTSSSNENSSLASTYIVNSKILVVAVAVLFGVVLFILCIHIYAKWYWRARQQAGNTGATQNAVQGAGGRSSTQSMFSYLNSSWSWRRIWQQMNFLSAGESNLAAQIQLLDQGLGLDKAVVELLPTFVYYREAENIKGTVLECAVCLEEFEEKETGRLLPKCNHSFHLDCIDMWFLSHSTCPLCRTSMKPDIDKAHDLWLELESNPSSPYQQFWVNESTVVSTTEAQAGSSLSSNIGSSATPGVSVQGSTQNQSWEEVANHGVNLGLRLEHQQQQLQDEAQQSQALATTSSSGPSSKGQEQSNVSNSAIVPAHIPPYVLFWGMRSTHENAQSSATGLNSPLEPPAQQGFHASGSGSGQAFSVAIDMMQPITPASSPVAVADSAAEAGPSSSRSLHMMQKVQLELSLKRLLGRGNNIVANVVTAAPPYNSSTDLEQGAAAGASSSTISQEPL